MGGVGEEALLASEGEVRWNEGAIASAFAFGIFAGCLTACLGAGLLGVGAMGRCSSIGCDGSYG
ncbi:MAG: hypothetical protein H0U76_26910 [Ktedonobacteraceae bacterium]|nr:hypothetical protein [Ktedonobacteraceae bacterium]